MVMLLFGYGGCYILNLSHLMVMLLFWTCASWYCNRCDQNLFLPLVIYISVNLYLCHFILWIFISVIWLKNMKLYISVCDCHFYLCAISLYVAIIFISVILWIFLLLFQCLWRQNGFIYIWIFIFSFLRINHDWMDVQFHCLLSQKCKQIVLCTGRKCLQNLAREPARFGPS
jgi:hypothetical protein